ncbi:hypothetical protein MBANPS3_007096 [Mucor bainieri]
MTMNPICMDAKHSFLYFLFNTLSTKWPFSNLTSTPSTFVLSMEQQSSSQIDLQQQQPSLFITSSKRVFQHLFKTSPDDKKPKTATTDPMNRLVSFHL